MTTIPQSLLAAILLTLAPVAEAIAQSGPPPGHRAMGVLPNSHGPCGSCELPSGLTARAQLTPPNEPGTPLEIAGVVYEGDGVTPAAGVTVFLFQTDVTGHYNTWNNPNDPRLRGWLVSDARGRYAFRTIKPAPYPSLNTPAHIHVHVFGPGRPEIFLDEFLFAGDPLLSARDKASRGRFSNVVELTSDSAGVLHGTRSLRLVQARRER